MEIATRTTPHFIVTVMCCGVLLAVTGCKPQVTAPVVDTPTTTATEKTESSPASSSSSPRPAPPEIFLESPGGLAFAHGAYDIAYGALSTEAPKDPKAAYLLGHLFQQGLGVERNPRRAIYWYGRAAQADVPEAHFALGMMAAYEQDMPSNYNEAFRWFSKAAELGHAEASLHVGLMYANGQGVARDLQHGLEWLDVAVEKEVPGAVEALAAVMDKLGPGGGGPAAENTK